MLNKYDYDYHDVYPHYGRDYYSHFPITPIFNYTVNIDCINPPKSKWYLFKYVYTCKIMPIIKYEAHLPQQLLHDKMPVDRFIIIKYDENSKKYIKETIFMHCVTTIKDIYGSYLTFRYQFMCISNKEFKTQNHNKILSKQNIIKRAKTHEIDALMKYIELFHKELHKDNCEEYNYKYIF